MRSLLPAVAEQLFRDVQKTYQETSQIPDDLLIALKFVFGPCALQALDLVDQRSVTCLSSPSGRKAYQGMVCRGLLGDISESCTLNSAETPNFMDMNSLWISVFGDSSAGVMGGSGCLYTCFVSCHYCPCPAFAYTVLRRNEGLLCKHILAVYLCQAMGVTQQESVSDQQMSVLLCRSATADA